MMVSAGSVSAESTTRPSTTIVDRDTNTVRSDRDNHTDWGWIGLLGLIGLAGLLPKNCTKDNDRNSDTGNRTLNR